MLPGAAGGGLSQAALGISSQQDHDLLKFSGKPGKAGHTDAGRSAGGGHARRGAGRVAPAKPGNKPVHAFKPAASRRPTPASLPQLDLLAHGANTEGESAALAGAPAATAAPSRQGWQAAIAATVQGQGYDLVEVERAGRGLLRVTIDRVPGRRYGAAGAGPGAEATDAGEFVTVDDCEAVTRQLQYVLEVEDLAYSRLEVSSPGLDRPLRHAADYRRFLGQRVRVTLREAFEGRKHWEGLLGAQAGAAETAFSLALQSAAAATAPGARKADKPKHRPAQPEAGRQLNFDLSEVREARLVPTVDFKGRRPQAGSTRPDNAGEAMDLRPPQDASAEDERQTDR